MIWFVCKQCGKRLRQPEGAGGSLVFCDCGMGTRVPWESAIPAPVEEPAAALPDAAEGRSPARSQQPVEIDPAYCLNHRDVPSEIECEECHERFCQSCIVQLRGKTLCGPCKNFQLARLERPPTGPALA